MPEYVYHDVPLDQLTDMIRYAATVLANTPKTELEAVRDDLMEAAEALIPAAEHVEQLEESGPLSAAQFTSPPALPEAS